MTSRPPRSRSARTDAGGTPEGKPANPSGVAVSPAGKGVDSTALPRLTAVNRADPPDPGKLLTPGGRPTKDSPEAFKVGFYKAEVAALARRLADRERELGEAEALIRWAYDASAWDDRSFRACWFAGAEAFLKARAARMGGG